MFPVEGIKDGDYRIIFGTNFEKTEDIGDIREIGEYGELSERKGHAKDHMLDLGNQETIPH